MSFLGGIMKSVINPMTLAQVAMGPAGWASIAMKAVMSAVGQQVIQAVGQKLGLPQSIINTAQQAFSARFGGGEAVAQFGSTPREIGRSLNMSPSQQGQLERATDSMSKSLSEQIMRLMGDEAKKIERGGGDAGEVSDRVGKRGGFLMAIATALGAAADQKMNDMYDLSKAIKNQTETNTKFVDGLGDKPSQGDQLKAQNNTTKLGSLNSQFSAVSQELGILQNVISTALKSIGEAQSTVARKG